MFVCYISIIFNDMGKFIYVIGFLLQITSVIPSGKISSVILFWLQHNTSRVFGKHNCSMLFYEQFSYLSPDYFFYIIFSLLFWHSSILILLSIYGKEDIFLLFKFNINNITKKIPLETIPVLCPKQSSQIFFFYYGFYFFIKLIIHTSILF